MDDDFIFGEEEGNEDFSDADIGDLFWDCEYSRGQKQFAVFLLLSTLFAQQLTWIVSQIMAVQVAWRTIPAGQVPAVTTSSAHHRRKWRR